jgi:hypothetical protein
MTLSDWMMDTHLIRHDGILDLPDGCCRGIEVANLWTTTHSLPKRDYIHANTPTKYKRVKYMQDFYGRNVCTWMKSIGLGFLVFLTLIRTIVLQGTHVHRLKKANIEFRMNGPNWLSWSWSSRFRANPCDDLYIR